MIPLALKKYNDTALPVDKIAFAFFGTVNLHSVILETLKILFKTGVEKQVEKTCKASLRLRLKHKIFLYAIISRLEFSIQHHR